MPRQSKLRAAAFVSLVWGGFFGLAGILIMNGGYYFTDSILSTRDFLLVAYQAFVRFGVLGAILGGVFAGGVMFAQAVRPAGELTAVRAAVLGAVCSALGGGLALTQLFGMSLGWMLLGSIGVLGAGLGTAMIGSMHHGSLPQTESRTRLAP